MLLKEMLQFEIMTMTGTHAAGKGDNKVTKEELDRERRRLNRRKVEVLNKHIFPAMANLTVFLEYMNYSPYIQNTFESDLKGLFFAKSASNTATEENKEETIFGRFIKACGVSTRRKQRIKKEDALSKGLRYTRFESVPEKERGGLEPIQDFRLVLWEIMMKKIWDMLPAVGEYKFKNDAFLNNILYADFGRAFSSISLLAQDAKERLEFDEERRPALF
jgi:hypothetical protein